MEIIIWIGLFLIIAKFLLKAFLLLIPISFRRKNKRILGKSKELFLMARSTVNEVDKRLSAHEACL